MNKLSFQSLGEELFEEVLDCGLRVIVLPKTGFYRKAATLLVPFGSIDAQVILPETEETLSFPEGTAHFLEHMLFESGEENISRRFALLGASVNAYTTYNRTAVYFTTTNGIDEPLGLLFDMLCCPRFKDKSVAKEREIIAKEIEMYKDDVEQTMYYDLMHSLYRKNTIQNDIAGAKASIAEITPEVLARAFEIFYQPHGLILVLSGDFELERIRDRIRSHRLFSQPGKKTPFVRVITPETSIVRTARKEKKRDLLTSLVMFGLKIPRETIVTPFEAALQEIRYQLFLDTYFGKTARIQETMLKKKLINSTFDFSVNADQGFGHVVIYAETNRPHQTIAFLEAMVRNLEQYTLDAENFQRLKRKMIGDFIQVFDSVSRANALISDYFMRGVNIFDLIEEISRLEPKDLDTLHSEIARISMAIVHYHA